jgi:hypothetical protein
LAWPRRTAYIRGFMLRCNMIVRRVIGFFRA